MTSFVYFKTYRSFISSNKFSVVSKLCEYNYTLRPNYCGKRFKFIIIINPYKKLRGVCVCGWVGVGAHTGSGTNNGPLLIIKSFITKP